MEQKKKMNDPLLELIPKEQLTARQMALLMTRQKARRPVSRYNDELPMVYRWLREPTHLDEIDWKNYDDIAIWCDNGSILCLLTRGDFGEAHNACFWISNGFLRECTIYGETEASMLETVVFLWSLKRLEESETRLFPCDFSINDVEYGFDFAILEPRQLGRILDTDPNRKFSVNRGVWSVEQSVILTSRPNRVDLDLSGKFTFEDGGTAFVDALEKRKSSFGSLHLNLYANKDPFTRANFDRLLELEIFEKLSIWFLNKNLARLPFSAKTKALSYAIRSDTMQPGDFDSLEIPTRDLRLIIDMKSEIDYWDELVIAFFHRVAELGHFERLSFLIGGHGQRCVQVLQVGKVACVAEALIHAVNMNPNLTYLDLGDLFCYEPKRCVDWAPYFPILFKAVEAHKGLRTLVVRNYPREDGANGPDYSLLEQLLSRNRNLTVVDRSGNKITNGTTIDKLYALNNFYNKSAELVKEPTSVRSVLVQKALLECKLDDFQRIGVVLSHHIDMLCDLIQNDMDLEEPSASQSLSEKADSIESATKKMRTSE